jgi:hypothetical protein
VRHLDHTVGELEGVSERPLIQWASAARSERLEQATSIHVGRRPEIEVSWCPARQQRLEGSAGEEEASAAIQPDGGRDLAARELDDVGLDEGAEPALPPGSMVAVGSAQARLVSPEEGSLQIPRPII